MNAREFDIVIYGASGYTGRLVAEYVVSRYRDDAGLSWAMAGRSIEKLRGVRSEVGAAETVALIAADADDARSIEAMAQRAKVVVTTVGPYQLYGEPLIDACVKAGTDYVDLCGEPAWMRAMIDKYDAAAKASGARIVFSCGFDSIPFDLGVFFLQQEAKRRFGTPCREVKGRVRKMKGKFSGGTAASLKATMAAAFRDPAVVEHLKNPFSLAGGFEGPKQPSGSKPLFDSDIDSWSAPFVMAPINTKNVHRSNALLGHPYGKDFLYSEMILTGPGEAGEKAANAVASDHSLMSDDGPKPGEGPTREERETGFYDILFVGATANGETLRASVAGDRDPGYGSTSKMIAEAALCLVRDRPERVGGVTTPAAALGDALIRRLEANAGLRFRIE